MSEKMNNMLIFELRTKLADVERGTGQLAADCEGTLPCGC